MMQLYSWAICMCFFLNLADSVVSNTLRGFNDTLEHRLLNSSWVDFSTKDKDD